MIIESFPEAVLDLDEINGVGFVVEELSLSKSVFLIMAGDLGLRSARLAAFIVLPALLFLDWGMVSSECNEKFLLVDLLFEFVKIALDSLSDKETGSGINKSSELSIIEL